MSGSSDGFSLSPTRRARGGPSPSSELPPSPMPRRMNAATADTAKTIAEAAGEIKHWLPRFICSFSVVYASGPEARRAALSFLAQPLLRSCRPSVSPLRCSRDCSLCTPRSSTRRAEGSPSEGVLPRTWPCASACAHQRYSRSWLGRTASTTGTTSLNYKQPAHLGRAVLPWERP